MKKYTLVIILSLFATLAKAQVLKVPLVTQETIDWCWDASSKCILNYYGDSIDQCTIAEYARVVQTWAHHGTVNCCINKDSCSFGNGLDGGGGTIADILHHYDSIKSMMMTKLELYQIPDVMDGTRPFVILWFWTGFSAGHIMVGHGVVDSNVYYMNPWIGEGFHIAKYDWVADDHGTHTWVSTQILTATPASVNTIAEQSKDEMLYPNPATGTVWIRNMGNDVTAVNIYDPVGKMVYSKKISPNSNNTQSLDISNMPRGIYFVQLCAPQNRQLKLVIR